MHCSHCKEQHPAGFYFCPQTGRAVTAWEEMVGLSYVDRYRLLKLLDTGGRGALFEGEEIVGGEKILLKIIHPEFARGESGIEPYLREASAVAGIEHPGLPRFVATGRDEGGAPYIVRRREDGESLAMRIAKKGPLPAPAALDLAEQVLGALAAAHGRGIAHRGITPARILLPQGPALLLDWGAAHLSAAAEGAPYRAPEQRQGGVGDARSDLYALGLTLVEALTGRTPSATGDGHEALAAAQGMLDATLGAVLEQALQDAPGDRFASADEFLSAVRAARAARMAVADTVQAPAVPPPAAPGAKPASPPAPMPASAAPPPAAAPPPPPAAAAPKPPPVTEAPAQAKPIGPKAPAHVGKDRRKRKRSNGMGVGSNGGSANAAIAAQGAVVATAADAGPTVRMSRPPDEVIAAQPFALDIEALERRATELSGMFHLPNEGDEAGPSGAVERVPVGAPVAAPIAAAPVPAMPLAPARAPVVVAADEDMPTGRGPMPFILGGVGVALVLLLIVILAGRDSNDDAPQSLFSRVHVSIVTRPANATLEIDGHVVQNPYDATEESSGQSHRIVARAPGYATDERSVKFDRDLTLEIGLRSLAPIAKAPPPPPPAVPTPPAPAAPTETPTPPEAATAEAPAAPAAPAAPEAPTAAATATPPEPPAPAPPAPVAPPAPAPPAPTKVAAAAPPAPAPAPAVTPPTAPQERVARPASPTPAQRRAARREARQRRAQQQAAAAVRRPAAPAKAPAKRPSRGGFVRDNPF